MKKCHAGIVVCAILFASAYKLTAWHYFSGQPRLITECATSYGGVASGRWGGFVQNGEETCGHAAPAFFLSCLEFPATEASIIEETGTASMLSLADMERVFARRGLRTQAVYVEPGYFKNQPVAAILHFSSQHFIVFLKEENGEPVIFDPAYGQEQVFRYPLCGGRPRLRRRDLFQKIPQKFLTLEARRPIIQTVSGIVGRLI